MVDGLPKEKEHFNTLGVAYPVLMTRILVWISVFNDGIEGTQILISNMTTPAQYIRIFRH